MIFYDASSSPALPMGRIRITDVRHAKTLPIFDFIVDSGADCSCVPQAALDNVLGLDYGIAKVRDYDGKEKAVRQVRILEATVEFLSPDDHVVLTGQYTNLKFLIVREGILGRDVLNQHVCELDGPGLRGQLR
jgi:hypothetical protein